MLKSFRWSSALVCLALGLASAAPARAADIEKFLPKDTDVVISLNVQQVLESSVVKKSALDLIKTSLATNKEAQEAFTALGLDPLKDFSRISVGLGIQDPSKPNAIVVIDGRFDVTKINDTLETLVVKDAKKFAKDKVGDRTIYKITTPDQPVMFFSPIDSKVLVFGTSKDYIATAFEAVKGTRTPEIKKELADLLAKADRKSSLTVVAYTKGRLDSLPLPDASMKKILEQIYSLTIDVKLAKDADLEVAVGTESADAAKQMQTMISFGLNFAKEQVKAAFAAQPELAPLGGLVNSLKAAQNEKNVVITGNLDGDSIEKLIKKDK